MKFYESQMIKCTSVLMEDMGYHVVDSPGGGDFFDLAGIRGESIEATTFLVELKVSDWKKVIEQISLRMKYADMVAIALPRLSLLEKAKEFMLDESKLIPGYVDYYPDNRHNVGLILVEHEKKALWIRKPKPLVKKHDRYQAYRDRTTGTLLAMRDGLMFGPYKYPSMAFISDLTHSVYGQPLYKAMKDWPESYKKMVGVRPKPETRRRLRGFKLRRAANQQRSLGDWMVSE